MNFDLQSLSTDTLLYMLMHSGAFVAIMGTVFFLIGLIFGHATWGRYKMQSRVMAAENDRQRQEIATLKRKLGDHSVKPGAAQLATETLSTLPPVAAAPIASSDTPPALQPLPPPAPPLPPDPITDTFSTTDLANSTTTAKAKPTKAKTSGRTKPAIETFPAIPPANNASPSAPSALPSPLAAIIAPQAPASAAKTENKSASAPAEPVSPIEPLDIFPELPTETHPSEIQPELDPTLGLIFKSRPTHIDDLTALKGIAKVLEQRLHEFGIYTYQQIASWTEDQIKEFSSRLAFKDRIHREKWVEQAQKLQAEKDHSPARPSADP